MKQLIEALTILLEYGDVKYPFYCKHEQLNIVGYDPKVFSEADRKRLRELGFEIQIEGEKLSYSDEICYESEIYSYRYGSA